MIHICIYIVLVSYGSCNKFPQACQIKTREISFQIVLEARNLAVVSWDKIKVLESQAPTDALVEPPLDTMCN